MPLTQALRTYRRPCRARSWSFNRFYSTGDDHTRVRRSLLYVPSSNSKMLQKSISSSADTLIYDLEDSVAHSEKERARFSLREFLKHAHETKAEISVRVNAVNTPMFVADIEALLPRPALKAIVLPKIHAKEDLTYASRMMEKVYPNREVSIIASIESAKGLWSVGEIASWQALEGRAKIVALLFAAEDYCADSGVKRTDKRTELWYARARMANAAKAFGLQAIDMVCVDYRDPDTLVAEAEEACNMGYTGKQAIHPSQVDSINKAFLPTSKEIRRAALILSGMKKSHESPEAAGAFGLELEGRTEMIDEPMVKQATKVIELARQGGLEIPDV